MSIRSYKDLEVWKRAYRLTVSVYQCTGDFPVQEKYGLTSQLQRAAVSIPSNIAEGYGRGMSGAYVNHLSIAMGSAAELETLFLLCKELGFIHEKHADELLESIDHISRMLRNLRVKVKASTLKRK